MSSSDGGLPPPAPAGTGGPFGDSPPGSAEPGPAGNSMSCHDFGWAEGGGFGAPGAGGAAPGGYPAAPSGTSPTLPRTAVASSWSALWACSLQVSSCPFKSCCSAASVSRSSPIMVLPGSIRQSDVIVQPYPSAARWIPSSSDLTDRTSASARDTAAATCLDS